MIRKTLLNKSRNIMSAFTLIELLVVIAIIGILATLASVSFVSSQRQARDTQRKNDLKQYQTVLEVYANKNQGLYPQYANGTSLTQMCESLSLSQNCPLDPNSESGQDYSYSSNGTLNDGSAGASEYFIWAQIESKTNQYWVVCSSGVSGEKSPAPTTGSCPL